MLEFFGGCPEIIVPDNLKSGVSKPCRYDPDLNPSYQQWAAHYQIAVIPARPYKPKDKAKVEVSVQIVERWILAKLRRQTFFSLAELNRCILLIFFCARYLVSLKLCVLLFFIFTTASNMVFKPFKNYAYIKYQISKIYKP